MSKSKLLGQFLQEKQEPFALEVYLNERTYHKSTSLNSSSNFHNPSKILKSSSTFALKKKKKRRNSAIPNCSIFLKVLFGQIVSANNNKKIKNSRNGGQISTTLRENRKNKEEGVGIQSMKSTGEFFGEKQAKVDRKLKSGEVEEHKQLSPVSVLVDTESDDEVSPLHYKQCHSKTTQGESSTSTSQCKFEKPTYYNTVQEFQEIADSDSYGQYVVNKRVLQQKKQLLIDCAREVIENHKKRDKRREQLKKILGADELWKLVCENLWIWSQDPIDESNIIHLLHSDLLASEEEWSEGSKQQKTDISIKVGDAILDDIINEEIFINGKFVYEL
ncbi:hypothetical protein ACJIZ3_025094 [Penstemon smallii]|uniref:DUF4378 domain-containing protein n=1 Tax=Penstemon smallii TaxID=265156 RepID=A0ABD3TVV5_9LAMI